MRRSIEDAVRRDTQIKEAHLIGKLVNIIHDCEGKLFQSYFEKTDRDDGMKGLGILSINPFQSSAVVKDTVHHHSEILDAAFHQPPSQYIGNYRSLLRSSSLPSAPASPSAVPTTPGEMVFSDSGCASEITSTMTSPDPGRRGTDLSKYSLPRDVRGKDVRSIREADLYSYDELDEAIAWSQVY